VSRAPDVDARVPRMASELAVLADNDIFNNYCAGRLQEKELRQRCFKIQLAVIRVAATWGEVWYAYRRAPTIRTSDPRRCGRVPDGGRTVAGTWNVGTPWSHPPGTWNLFPP
jgi:hypothetical protein